MGKLHKISVALVLALMLCVTMLGSSAFAQGVARNDTHAMATNTQQTVQSTTIDLRQTQLRPQLFCRWVPSHWLWYWVPSHWVHIPRYPYALWVPGHLVKHWVPGHSGCVVIRRR